MMCQSKAPDGPSPSAVPRRPCAEHAAAAGLGPACLRERLPASVASEQCAARSAAWADQRRHHHRPRRRKGCQGGVRAHAHLARAPCTLLCTLPSVSPTRTRSACTPTCARRFASPCCTSSRCRLSSTRKMAFFFQKSTALDHPHHPDQHQGRQLPHALVFGMFYFLYSIF